MILNECVYWVGTAVVLYDALVAWAHISVYGKWSNWRMFEEGRALMATMATFALVLTYTGLVNLQVGFTQLTQATLLGYPQRGLIKIIIFGVLGAVVTWWLILVLRNQRRSRGNDGR